MENWKANKHSLARTLALDELQTAFTKALDEGLDARSMIELLEYMASRRAGYRPPRPSETLSPGKRAEAERAASLADSKEGA